MSRSRNLPTIAEGQLLGRMRKISVGFKPSVFDAIRVRARANCISFSAQVERLCEVGLFVSASMPAKEIEGAIRHEELAPA